MIVPVHVHYRDLEELCYYDDWEKSVICDDYNADHEYTVDEVEFDRADLEDIVNEYFDDIIDILLRNHKSRISKLLKVRYDQRF
ncbi:cysteinyl-tRNA synthetase [Stygiolobus sp. RP850M]|uniref:cysteinyl-tRNA synthetase n=1 Tax=Stygiolobus sp. RP850M TaxID=3133137 RepID=UPI00307E0242